jgi:uncharacterized protein (TIGR04222 family)
MSLGPFDLPGGPFLTLYAILLAITVVAGFLIPRWLRPHGRTIPVNDPDRLAYLAGGSARFVETVVTRLLASGALAFAKGKFTPATLGGGSEAERSVLAVPAGSGWSRVAGAAGKHARTVERRLIADGLLMESGEAWQLRFWQTAPYALLILFGAIKWDVGVLRDRPVGFLTLLLIATGVLGLIRFLVLDRRTRGGIAALSEVRDRSDRLRRAPARDELDTGVALFGVAVLAGSGLDDFRRLRADNGGSGDGGSSSSSGDGGCGGGGGGCGGCGGS